MNEVGQEKGDVTAKGNEPRSPFVQNLLRIIGRSRKEDPKKVLTSIAREASEPEQQTDVQKINKDVKSFTTARGSVYTYDADGKTTRFKTATGEQQERQDITVFVDLTPSQQQLVLEAYHHTSQADQKVYVLERQPDESARILRDISEVVDPERVYLAAIEKDKYTVLQKASLRPIVGHYVFDTRRFEENGQMMTERHLGNKVVSIEIQKKDSPDNQVQAPSLSRRALFQKATPKLADQNSETLAGGQREISRRYALKFLAGLGAAFALDAGGVKIGRDSEPILQAAHNNPQEVLQILARSSSFDKEGNKEASSILAHVATADPAENGAYMQTVIEQSMVMAAKVLVDKVLTYLHVEHGNQSFSKEAVVQKLSEHPIETLIMNVGITPVIEEFMFRLLPSDVFAGKTKQERWDIGIPSSVLFALIHNIPSEHTNPASLESMLPKEFKKSIPVTQFMGGMFYWYLMREKGISHAILAHSMNNTAFALGSILTYGFPKQKEDANTQNS